MGVLQDREHQPGGITSGRVITGPAFHDSPAIVLTTDTAGRCYIDLFQLALTDVGDVQVPRLAVKAEAPGIPQPVIPDLLRNWVLCAYGFEAGMM